MRPRRTGSSAVQALRAALPPDIEILSPSEAEEPILAPGARAAVFEWLAELRAVEELRAVGVKPRSSALLSGPPGCGKTTLAHHLAARLGIPMVLVGAEMLKDKYVGEGEKKVAALFNALEREQTPCLLFMDEIEGVGRKRSSAGEGGAGSANLAQLGVLLRKVESFTGMMVAATNMPDELDPALWRRFGMQIVVDLPRDDERFAIIKRYLAPYTLPDDDVDLLCDLTDGASPALLRGLMEGVKRTLILGPRMGRDLTNAPAVLGPLLSALRPPPEMRVPTLWTPEGLAETAAMTWPPAPSEAA